MKKTAREELKNKKRIVIKIGSSSLTHPETGENLVKIERLIRVISDLRGMGRGGPGVLGSHVQRAVRPWAARSPDGGGKAGLCGCGPGQAHDGIPEDLLSITRRRPRSL